MNRRFRPSAGPSSDGPRKIRSLFDRLRTISGFSKPVAPQPLMAGNRAERTIHPPEQHVELRFNDGTIKIVDPRSPEASALQELADQLRKTCP